MTATTPTCVCCGRPTADGYACHEDAQNLAQRLREAAGHAEDAWTVIARQARMGTAGGGRRLDPDPVAADDPRRNPVTTFGWQASIERPIAGGLRPEPTPADLGALDRLHAAENAIGTWARALDSDAAGLPAACRWLAEHVDELRAHPAAAEAFRELGDACASLERLVDRPAGGQRLVGMCDCGQILYAAADRLVVKCKGRPRSCGATWNVDESQDILMDHLDGQLVTAAEAAHLAAFLDTDRTQEQIRKLVNAWHKRHQVLAHGQVWRDPTQAELDADPEVTAVAMPTFRFGEIRARIAATPRRNREGAAA